MGMSITETLRLQALEHELAEATRQLADQGRRIDALEAQLAGAHPARGTVHQIPTPLCQINAARQVRCNALRAALTRVLAQVPHPASITAKDVAQELARVGFEPIPSERTVRLRLAEVRQRAATHGNTLCCRKSA